MENNALRDVIFEAMELDDSYVPRYDKKIKETYEKSEPYIQDKIDEIFITLTGYSLELLIKFSEEE